MVQGFEFDMQYKLESVETKLYNIIKNVNT